MEKNKVRQEKENQYDKEKMEEEGSKGWKRKTIGRRKRRKKKKVSQEK